MRPLAVAVTKSISFSHAQFGTCQRHHAALDGRTPDPRAGADSARPSISQYRWQPHCRGLYQTPIAA